MNDPTKRILVIGASGGIGKHLIRYLMPHQHLQLTTAGRTPEDDYFLDLAQINTRDDVPKGFPEFDTVVLLSALSNIAACETQPKDAMQINAMVVQHLYRTIRAKHWILFSTNQVFGGDKANPRREDKTSAVSQYGISKVAMETMFASDTDSVAILRLTKVIMPEQPFLKQSLQKLRNGESVTAFANMNMAPISVSDVCQYVFALLERFAGGLHQLSGQRDVSYYDTLFRLANKLGADPSKVQASDTELSCPKNTALFVDTLEKELGFNSPDIDRVLERFLVMSQ